VIEGKGLQGSMVKPSRLPHPVKRVIGHAILGGQFEFLTRSPHVANFHVGFVAGHRIGHHLAHALNCLWCWCEKGWNMWVNF